MVVVKRWKREVFSSSRHACPASGWEARLTHNSQHRQDANIKLEAQGSLGRMIDDARRLFNEALLLALDLVEVVVGADVLGHGIVDLLDGHDDGNVSQIDTNVK